MLKEIVHIGLTISDIEESIKFYRDILGLKLTGRITMTGEETDKLFNCKNTKVNIAYLIGTDEIISPPIELIEFESKEIERVESSLMRTSISELCFSVDDINKFYKHLKENNIECISEPQKFDFSEFGFGKSKALYFKDPDGIILEELEALE
ncbi:MAG: VOC family protein [Andreesenia angusta]|nr:VOC family protein [Andreesenia angusta]